MPDISGDRYYQREIIPPNLRALGEALADHFGVPPANIGIRGHPRTHLRGYHRSRNFLLHSRFSRGRTYSVSDHPDNQRGDMDWVCGLDFTLPHPQLLGACRRLDIAVRAGTLPQVAEWYGNTDGDQRVDGYDNIARAIATSEPSHLWHGHIGLFRKHANDDHNDLFAVLTGADPDEEDNDMDQNTPITQAGDVAIGNIPGGTITRPLRWWLSWGPAHIVGLETQLADIRAQLAANAAADAARDNAALSAVQILADAARDPGRPLDTADVLAQIRAEAAATRDLVAQKADLALAAERARLTALAEALNDAAHG